MGIRKNTADGKQNKQGPQQHNKGKDERKSKKNNTGNKQYDRKGKQAGPAKRNNVTFYLYNLLRITSI